MFDMQLVDQALEEDAAVKAAAAAREANMPAPMPDQKPFPVGGRAPMAPRQMIPQMLTTSIQQAAAGLGTASGGGKWWSGPLVTGVGAGVVAVGALFLHHQLGPEKGKSKPIKLDAQTLMTVLGIIIAVAAISAILQKMGNMRAEGAALAAAAGLGR